PGVQDRARTGARPESAKDKSLARLMHAEDRKRIAVVGAEDGIESARFNGGSAFGEFHATFRSFVGAGAAVKMTAAAPRTIVSTVAAIAKPDSGRMPSSPVFTFVSRRCRGGADCFRRRRVACSTE